jgi:tartrate-resistant acid phosphatase type 5
MKTINRRTVVQSGAALCLTATLPMRAWAQSQEQPLSFLALGDWGRDGGREQTEVAAAMAKTAAEVGSRFVLSAGDNFYPGGVRSVRDPHWKASFEDVYSAASLQTPWYAALGNHDYRGKPKAQIRYSAHSQRWNMPHRYYQVDRQILPDDLDIFVLDTTPMVGGVGEGIVRLSLGRISVPDPAQQLVWLDTQLAKSRATWKVVVGHHPIRSGGHHGGSATLKEQLEPLLTRYGVQVYICGHDHTLQHVQAGGLHHICTGAGSSAGEVGSIKGTRFAGSEPGFAVFTLAPGAMGLGFRGAGGNTLYEASLPQRTV